jgi:hypothetical protein
MELARSYTGPNKAWIKRQYGLDAELHGGMYAQQAGRCAICDMKGDLVVDHDHSTGEVRGLLCSHCNLALGLMKDSPLALTKAIAYLLSPPSRMAVTIAQRRAESA